MRAVALSVISHSFSFSLFSVFRFFLFSAAVRGWAFCLRRPATAMQLSCRVFGRTALMKHFIALSGAQVANHFKARHVFSPAGISHKTKLQPATENKRKRLAKRASWLATKNAIKRDRTVNSECNDARLNATSRDHFRLQSQPNTQISK